jgi:hypothetical protein
MEDLRKRGKGRGDVLSDRESSEEIEKNGWDKRKE